jgi:hypothetical protein
MLSEPDPRVCGELPDWQARTAADFFLRGIAMYRAVLDDTLKPGSGFDAAMDASRQAAPSFVGEEARRIGGGTVADGSNGPRRTPRKSLIVVLPDNHVVSPEVVAAGLPQTGDHELVDVIVACAGQPASLAALTRRELAIRHSPGDIVTLLSGAVLPSSTSEFEMFGTV